MEDPNAETLGLASKRISEVRLLLLTCDSHYHHWPLSCMQINWRSNAVLGGSNSSAENRRRFFSVVLSENRHENLLDSSHSFEKGPVLMVKS
jgi:hypothetical protein